MASSGPKKEFKILVPLAAVVYSYSACGFLITIIGATLPDVADAFGVRNAAEMWRNVAAHVRAYSHTCLGAPCRWG
jgi:hypothetical protein